MYEKTTDGDLYKEYKCNTKSGRLKVFFGYAAGVGKTYAMLDAAHSAKKNGVDVVAGYIQPQNRPETSALVEGLETLPLLNIEYKGRVFNEFNLDEALKRNPHLILVDELAHTNPIGCRHKKRYSDIEELLRAGIDVYTTVNVQHLESLNDVVEAITNIKVSERIPDRIFDNANQVKLVDIEPDDLIERLNQGKVYNKEQASRALDNFFTRENLASLREIALRRTADRVKNLEEEKKFYGNRDHFTGEHILLCLSSSPSNEKVIRAAARLGAAFHGSLTALYVETFDAAALPPESKKQLRKNLKIARDLGAKIVTVYGEDIPYQISKYAKASGVSKIVMGRSNTKGNFIGKKINFVERLINQAPSIDIYIIPDNLPKYEGKNRKLRLPKFEVGDIAKSIGILLICTLIGLVFYEY
ncbi:MAG: histidine kinase, partial [Clostridium sp.]